MVIEPMPVISGSITNETRLIALILQMKQTIKKYAVALTVGFFSFCQAGAQDIMPEQLPKKPAAERIVREVSPVGDLLSSEAVTIKKAEARTNNFGENVVKTALQYLGARYRSGMSGPYAFDCSGFTSFVYKQNNLPILRSSRSQFTQGTPIASTSDLQKGDLVFFGGSRGARSVGHVGIVTDVDAESGNFSFIHAASSGGVKISESNEAYYSRRYMGARRISEN